MVQQESSDMHSDEYLVHLNKHYTENENQSCYKNFGKSSLPKDHLSINTIIVHYSL